LSPIFLHAQSTDYRHPDQGDFVVKDFQFKSGEQLPELKIHYCTLGVPRKDSQGVVRNAVLVLHSTGGSMKQYLTENFAGVLFGPGQLLDGAKYFIVIPDNIGHGQSSKPHDALHMHFPHYEYDDMIELQYRLVTQKLGLNHLRLVMGASMGGMHTWLWGEQHPGMMDALLPLASQPIEIAGRNRMWRRTIMDAIRNDPEWNNGEYKSQPHALATAIAMLLIMSGNPARIQKEEPTRQKTDAYLEEQIANRMKTADANDMLYYVDASRNYNPEPHLEGITAPLTAINSTDDAINPPELKVIDKHIRRVAKGKYVLLPASEDTRGHSTHTWPAFWQQHLAELLERSGYK
jgi:homoserine O-acetyltransferase/O-succinyltransferase